MIVRYSSLNRLEKPKFTLCNPGSVFTDGLLSNIVGMLVDTEAEEIVFNFNATSELSMRINRIRRETPEDNAHVLAIYGAVQNRRLIYVEDIGYFMITNVENGFDGKIHYKDVKAESIDIEIAQKMVPYIPDGTYKFTNPEDADKRGILESIVETLPLWTIGEVDETVANKYRTFEDVDTSLNCLSFLLTNVQDAYECIIVFDNIHRTINVYSQDNYVRETEIHITKEGLINALDVTENADDLYTAITVLGNDNVTISAINPLGTNTIYDFSYYYDWMSDGLGEKVQSWQSAMEEAREPYYDLNLMYYKQLADISDLEMEIERLNIQITMYTRCRDNIIAGSANNTAMIGSYNTVIVENGGTAITVYREVADTIACIDALIAECEAQRNDVSTRLEQAQALLETYSNDIDHFRDTLSIDTYFTEEEYTELCHYIYEGSYSDDYVTITDVMTYDEKFAQMKTLYDRAVSQLLRVSRPTQEFNVDVENFIFSKEFEKWSEQLETGCLINVELDTNDIAPLFLCTITINYDDRSLNMKFGNRFNKFDMKSLFNDMLGNISKSANTLSYIKDVIYPIKNGELDHMQEFLQTSRDLTMRSALASTNEEVIIDGSGYTGKRLLENGEYDPRQVKIVCNSMVFTDDAWESSKVAIGEIILTDGGSVYGVNAEALMGQFIVGEHLHIINQSGNLSFSNDGLRVANDTNAFSVNPNSTKLLAISNSKEDVLYVDVDGMLHVNGDIVATSLTLGDDVTLGTDTEDGSSSYLHISTDGLLTAKNAVIHGSIYADNGEFSGTIRSSTIEGGTITIGGKFSVSEGGVMKCSGADISGVLTAGIGSSLGNFKTDSNSVYFGSWKDSAGNDVAPNVFMCTGSTGAIELAGHTSSDDNGWCFGAGENFGVTANGDLYASNATLSGGRISQWDIVEDGLLSRIRGRTYIYTDGTFCFNPAIGYWCGFLESEDGSGIYNFVIGDNANLKMGNTLLSESQLRIGNSTSSLAQLQIGDTALNEAQLKKILALI